MTGAVYADGLAPDDIHTSRLSVVSPRIRKSFTLAFISDLHIGMYGVRDRLYESAVERVMAERPDLILLGGDLLYGGRASLAHAVSILAPLTAPLGVFSVLGNHEFRWDADECRRMLDASPNLRLLRDERVVLEAGGGRVALYGLDNFFSRTVKSQRGLIEDIRHDVWPLVLEHTPDLAPELGREFSGLLLAGHTHGGQIVLPGVRGLASASKYGSHFLGGRYAVGRGEMYVTRGVGAVMLPVRIGCPPEIVIVTVQPKSEEIV